MSSMWEKDPFVEPKRNRVWRRAGEHRARAALRLYFSLRFVFWLP